MKVVAAVLAAGKGTRFGGDKVWERLGDRPVWRWSYDTLGQHPSVDRVFVVTGADRLALFGEAGVEAVEGGATRQESSRNAVLAAEDADVLLIHDAARPFVTHEVIDRVLRGIEEATAAAAALPVSDTIKEMTEGRIRTLDRSHLWAMQTPQGAYRDVLYQAHMAARAEMTDEMALVEALGVHPMIVNGDPNNFKITTPEDLDRARARLEVETRTGIGYDIHAFCDEPGRILMLGGVAFPEARPLAGHSDADVLLHAVTDALLGAVAMGDIGEHFPNTDPRWHNEPSLTFLRHASELIRGDGWEVVNVDATLLAETPKVMRRAGEMRETIAAAIGVDANRVSIKATTNEGLGAIGRSEGIAATAIANVRRRI